MLDRTTSRRDRLRAERQRRHRQRQRAGQRCGRFTYDAALLNLLIDLGWLAEVAAGDQAAVDAAVTNLLFDAGRRHEGR
jgi:hypothetical protein